MTDDKLQKLLEEVIAIKKDETSDAGNHYFGKMHLLAEAHYQPALEFFITCLDDKRASWREYCLMALGFHYDVSENLALLQKIKDILSFDPSDFVRLTAAGVLSAQLTEPDFALLQLLDQEKDSMVRFTIIEACLLKSDIPYAEKNALIEEIFEYREQLDFQHAKEILAELGIDIDP